MVLHSSVNGMAGELAGITSGCRFFLLKSKINGGGDGTPVEPSPAFKYVLL